MQLRFKRSLAVYLSSALIFSGCGAGSNLFGLTVPPLHQESFEHRLAMAQAAYDAGELQTAKGNIDKAFQLDPNSERASLLYGFVYLSLAGADPFSLARRMSAEDDDEGEGAEESSTTSELSKLEAAVGLTENEKLELGTLDNSDVDLPVLIPLCAEKARAVSEKLGFLAQAVYAACPFVSDSARMVMEPRHRCAPTKLHVNNSSKAHFLWAFAHLAEALAFNSVLNYGTMSGEASNLQKRVEKIKTMSVETPKQLTEFLASVDALGDTVSAVLPVGGNCSTDYPTSMLVGTLNDMLAVSAAFGELAGMPPSIVSGIKKSMAKIITLSGNSAKIDTLKADVTKKMGSTLAEKFDALDADGEGVTEDQRLRLCSSFATISPGSTSKPTMCDGIL